MATVLGTYPVWTYSYNDWTVEYFLKVSELSKSSEKDVYGYTSIKRRFRWGGYIRITAANEDLLFNFSGTNKYKITQFFANLNQSAYYGAQSGDANGHLWSGSFKISANSTIEKQLFNYSPDSDEILYTSADGRFIFDVVTTSNFYIRPYEADVNDQSQRVYISKENINTRVELPINDRAVKVLTAPNFNDEESPTITYDTPITAWNVWGYNIFNTEAQLKRDLLQSLQASISFDGVTPAIDYRDIPIDATTYTFNLTTADREALQKGVQGSNSKPAYFLIKAHYDSIDTTDWYADVVSNKEKTITIINCEPILSPRVYDTNEATKALTGNENVLVRYFSSAKAVLNAWTQKNATLQEYYIKYGAVRYNDPIYTFENVENNIFDFYVIDSRNNYKTATLTPSMVEYIKLTCDLKDNKPDTDGNMTVESSGNYFNGNFGAVANTLQVQYRYGEEGEALSEWRDMAVNISGNTYTATYELTGLDYQKTYTFEARATDQLTTISSGETSLKSLPVFHWSKDDFVFEVPVTFRAGLTDGDIVIEQGDHGDWYYRKWGSGIAECWGMLTKEITASDWNSYFTLYQAEIASFVDYPIEFTEVPKETATLYSTCGGWLDCSAFGMSNKNTGAYFITRPNALTSNHSALVIVYAVGKWK